MKVIYILLISIILLLACKELGDAIYEPPVIESLTLTPDGSVLPGDTVKAVVVASNPEEGQLSYSWEVSPDDGTFLSPVDLDSIKWVAPFKGGDYSIKAVVRNDKKESQSKNVTVQSPDDPVVKLSSPKNGQSFIIDEPIEVTATAYHDNGLSMIILYANDTPVDTSSGNSGTSYSLHFNPDASYVGPVRLKLVAEALLTGRTNSDYVDVFVQGIVLKSGVNH